MTNYSTDWNEQGVITVNINGTAYEFNEKDAQKFVYAVEDALRDYREAQRQKRIVKWVPFVYDHSVRGHVRPADKPEFTSIKDFQQWAESYLQKTYSGDWYRYSEDEDNMRWQTHGRNTCDGMIPIAFYEVDANDKIVFPLDE